MCACHKFPLRGIPVVIKCAKWLAAQMVMDIFSFMNVKLAKAVMIKTILKTKVQPKSSLN